VALLDFLDFLNFIIIIEVLLPSSAATSVESSYLHLKWLWAFL
jgi:hypothetical protein